MRHASRLDKINDCQTVTGVVSVVESHSDGDIAIHVKLDAKYENLLNGANRSNLDGTLMTEAICQAPIHGVAGAKQACAGLTSSVTIPHVGARVKVTGSYVLDKNHGWMEIHPISELSVLH